jgi:hypothetical protein
VVVGPWLLGAWLLATAAVIATWRLAERRLHAEPQERRLAPAFAMAVYPAGAVRALDLHTRGALAAFDPVAIALAAGDERTRDAVATVALRETLWRSSSTTIGAGRARRRVVPRGVRARAAARVLTPASTEVARAGPRRSASATAFCPRCRAHSATDRRLCADCDGVELVPFEANVDDDSVEDEEE